MSPSRASGPDLVPLRRDKHPDQWRELAAGDDFVITQVDDGNPIGGDVGDLITSSASMPRVVALMLQHLDVHGAERVLEIGTGTGWNAALLAHRLGADRVTTIEVDPRVATHARKALTDLPRHQPDGRYRLSTRRFGRYRLMLVPCVTVLERDPATQLYYI